VSVITPSLNQGRFIEETIRSVLEQDYPNLEYIVIDGGSKDDTTRIIQKYEGDIFYWESQPDRGQCHAINKGFAKATGDIIAWLNSDDVYLPSTIRRATARQGKNDHVRWRSYSDVRSA
jgi:glycosyltransferase involved in cell wall biosynthesis